MRNLISGVVLSTLCATAAFAQTHPTTNLAPVIVEQQMQANRQQTLNQSQTNAQATVQEQTHMNQAVSGMAQQNQKILNSQLPPKPTPLMTGSVNR